MKNTAALALALLVAASAAEANPRHHADGWRTTPPLPGLHAVSDRRRRESRSLRPYLDADHGTLSLVPADWRILPADEKWDGRRFVSPDGESWLAIYASKKDEAGIAEHLKTVAFVDGEQVTYLQGGRYWVVVSGTKGDRIFYRKALYACGDRIWHHVALEYPAALKKSYDRMITAVSRSLSPPRGEYACAEDDSSAGRRRR